MLFAIAGVLEGFYGPPWSWDDRVAVMERCVPAGLPWYVWAPKSDPLHRASWRLPFSDDHLDGFRRLLTVDGLQLGVAVSPGLDPGDLDADADALAAKLEPVLALGATLMMIAFDDIAAGVTNAERHAALVCALMDRVDLGGVHVVVVPTHYATTHATDYLTTLAAGLPPDVMIGWTGAEVVNDTITAVQADAFADAVEGRPLALWDNYPVNDALLADRAFLLPLAGRDAALSEYCGAYFANAAVQPWLSLPPLLATAAWVRTGSAEVNWEESFDEPVALTLLAQACDGRELYRLAERAVVEDDTDDLWWWLERIEALSLDGPMGVAAGPWIAQAQEEATVSLLALELLEREPGEPDVFGLVMGLWRAWPKVRRGTNTVLGSRFSLSPRASIDPDGVWQLRSGGVTENRNVTDYLCRAALERHSLPII